MSTPTGEETHVRRQAVLDQVERAKKPSRVPVVPTRDEVHKLFAFAFSSNLVRPSQS